MRKYGNKKVTVDGIKFDSKREANRYRELELMRRGGLIKNLEIHPKFTLMDGFTKSHGGGLNEKDIFY